MTSVGLNESATVTLDASGNGTASVGPSGQGETWTPAYVHVKTNQAASAIASEAQCIVYTGPQATDQYYADGTLSGSTGDTTDVVGAYQLGKGDYVWAKWVGGDPGAEGIVRVTGTKDI
ncbi:MAG TPA: hypothetical protein VGG75_05695 [Trebonia sp.]|jgi:hypothetical protein